MSSALPRVALDMYVLAQGVKTGIYRVCDELFPLLARSPRIDTRLFCRPGDEAGVADYVQAKGLRAHTLRGLPDGVDVLLSPFGVAPVDWLMDSHVLHAHIVYDLIAIKHPEFFSAEAAAEVRNIVDSIDEHTVVFAISEFTKNDLLACRPDLTARQVTVIPLAAGPAFAPCEWKSRRAEVRLKYGIPPAVPYVLSLATLEIRKNLDQVVKAFVLYLDQNKESALQLVLSGMSGWKLEELRGALSAAERWRHRIVLTGFVDDEDLSALYSDALCFVYLSRYEGFGLPPLEAMACGTPVISSNNSSLPEVVGDAGVMLDADETQGVVDALRRIASDDVYRACLSAAGLERARRFNWERCAEIVVQTLVVAGMRHLQRPPDRRRLSLAPGVLAHKALRPDGIMEANFIHFQNGSHGPRFERSAPAGAQCNGASRWPVWVDRLQHAHEDGGVFVEGGLRMRGVCKSGTLDEPLVTYITVVRNNAVTLARTIESVQRQTYPNVEHIVLDGASTDGTLDVIRQYGERIDYFASEPDGGLYDAVNKAIPLARGRLICILNSDDWLEPQAAEIAVERMRTAGESALLVSAASVRGAHVAMEWYPAFVHPGSYFTCANDCHNGMYATRAAYESSGPYDVSYKIAADFKWVMTCLEAAVTFVYTREVTVNYSLGGTSGDVRKHSLECMRVVAERFPSLIQAELTGLYYCFFFASQNLPDLPDRPASRTQFLREVFASHAGDPEFLSALSWASICQLEHPADRPIAASVGPAVAEPVAAAAAAATAPTFKNMVKAALRSHPAVFKIVQRLHALTRKT